MAAADRGGSRCGHRSSGRRDHAAPHPRFEAYRDRPLTADQIEFFEELYGFVAALGGVDEIERRAIRAEAMNDMDRAFLALPARATARQTLALVDGTAKEATPFLTHLGAWQERTHLKGKYLDQAVYAIEAFAKAVPCSLETLTGAMVQGWIERLLKPTDGSKPTGDVPRLWTQAGDDTDLAAIIQIGGFTGMRREEIYSLTVDQVRMHDGIMYLHKVGRKTRSAIRNVLIPTAISALIDELCAHATKDGYLIHDGTLDK